MARLLGLWTVFGVCCVAVCGQESHSLRQVVEEYLWPRSPAEFEKAQRLVGDGTWQDLSLGEFHDAEELIRAGRPPQRAAWTSASSDQAVEFEIEVEAPGGTIPVFIQVPPGYRPDRRWPLIFAMHGGPPRTQRQARSGAERMLRVWSASAARASWIVASPAMNNTVSVDRFMPDRLPYEVFHAEQARAVLEAVKERLQVDPNRVVSTGISLGSNFSLAYAASHPDWFSAIVPVSTEGESRERLLRNLAAVPVYVLEGSRDGNIRGIDGPRAMSEILTSLGADLTYREFSGRTHEGFSEHYDDVLRWLDQRPRCNYPRIVSRVPHRGILPVARRVHWIESDTRQGMMRARVTASNRIEMQASKTRRVKLYLHDRLVDLDHPIEVWINGVRAFAGQVRRSLGEALKQVKLQDEGRVWAAVLEVDVPRSPQALAASEEFEKELVPSPNHPEGRLSFWEMYAVKALEERFPSLGLSGAEVPGPSQMSLFPGQTALLVENVVEEGPFAASGLRPGDLLIEVDGTPFFKGEGWSGLHDWLVRELRSWESRIPLLVWRGGQKVRLEAKLRLGPYLRTSPAPQGGAQRPLITFDHYHRFEEIETFLRAAVRRYSSIAKLITIGRSWGGRPILAVEIHNPKTGPAEEKPGFYLDGNIHGGEVLAGEGALYFVNHLLTGYGKDAEVTRLVDANAFYIVPIVNPDGRAISVDTPENHRWNIRPVDQDGDGLTDEDPPEDLDGDGRILRMRIPDAEGRWKISDRDARLMVRRSPRDKEGPFYRLLSEGIDNDLDGRFNEDIIGGVDINRNFPSNWHPAQFASGLYPLSEPESRALVDYITARPNIAAIHTYHTSGGLLLRFPTLADQDWEFPRADLEDYRIIAQEGVKLTGYDNFAFEKKKIVDLMSPGHGVFNDWGSNVFGVPAMTTEMWKHAIGQGQEALLRWNDEVLEGKGFIAWKPFRHPQLGDVELGGWDRWSISSPPEHLIAAELERNNSWVMSFVRRLPRVAVVEASVAPEGDAFRIRASVANVGWLPTATAHAAQVLKIARPARVRLKLDNARLLEGKSEVSLGVLPGAREKGPEVRRLEWRVEVVDASRPAAVEVEVISRKAGRALRRIEIRADR